MSLFRLESGIEQVCGSSTSETLHIVADMAGKVSRWLVLVDIITYGTRVAKEHSDS